MNKKIKVLVVEDEKLLLEAIGKKMELENIEAQLAASGSAAFEILEKNSHIPDVIWLDYHLTDMDGLQFMGRLQKNEAWKQIPVIVVSNTASDDKIHAMLLLGAKKYVVKAESKLVDIISTAKEVAADSQQ